MTARTSQQPLPAWEDYTVDRAIWGEHCLPGVPSKSGRKQHRSCDQCRKGKKGCDAPILKGLPNSFCSDLVDYDVEGSGGRGIISLGPCSNCKKTCKDCTFVWLRSQEKDRIQRINNGSGPSSKRAKLRATESRSDISSLVGLPSDVNQGYLNTFSVPSSSPNITGRAQNECSPFTSLEQWARPPSSQCDYVEMSEGGDVFAPIDNFSTISQPRSGRTSFGEEFNQPASFPNFEWSEPVKNTKSFSDSISEGTSNSLGCSSSASFEFPRVGKLRNGTPRHRKRQLHSPADISPFSIPEKLATFTNKSLMTENLMKVYHDSMENALSCWLTERTCPYGNRALSSSGASSIDRSMLREWGPDWSNRICRQVINLDRKSAAIRDRPLTRSEEKAVSNALNLAIMAFATQWSQSSERSRTKFQPFDTNGVDWEQFHDPVADDLKAEQDFELPAMEFDRLIQENLWAQAKRAIQDATHIESFRVVFAHIIFALTQRPLSIDHLSLSPRSRVWKQSSRNADTAPSSSSEHIRQNYSRIHLEATVREEQRRLIEELEDVINHDGPPVFLEQGLRHIHSLRCKLDRVKSQLWKVKDGRGTTNPKGDSTSTPLTREDWKTVDLLYWLGVMFDTLSAAFHNRPLVVSDEDSDIHPEASPNPNNLHHHTLSDENREVLLHEPHGSSQPISKGTSNLWSSFFFQAQGPRKSAPPTRWPCSYEAAATVLADAAPIKVLLFRKVTRIQTLISRHIVGEKLEDAVKDALYVHQYWNTLYRPFMLDLVANHDQLPARIQSWYICLTGHWHLAVLLLADNIQTIDGDGLLGLESHRRWRESCGLVTALRRRTSHAVADLAMCSCPREDASFPDTGEFHFALNQGALLTEPWTQVLIRVFAKAGALLLADAAISKYGIDSGKSCKEALQRSEACIEALWYLGRKSDMARLTAKVLTKALKSARENMVAAEMSQLSEEWLQPEFSLDDDFSFSSLSSEPEDPFQRMIDADFGLLAEDSRQNFVDLTDIGRFESFL